MRDTLYCCSSIFILIICILYSLWSKGIQFYDLFCFRLGLKLLSCFWIKGMLYVTLSCCLPYVFVCIFCSSFIYFFFNAICAGLPATFKCCDISMVHQKTSVSEPRCMHKMSTRGNSILVRRNSCLFCKHDLMKPILLFSIACTIMKPILLFSVVYTIEVTNSFVISNWNLNLAEEY